MNPTIPTIELLERAHTFPCQYLFKVIGKSDAGFIAEVVAIVRAELDMSADPSYQIREAAGARHASITLEPDVQSPQQVLAIYRRLSMLDGVVMMF